MFLATADLALDHWSELPNDVVSGLGGGSDAT
jgi:hypothetical protein